MWMFINIIFMVQLTISGSISLSEEPVDSIGILGDDMQLNCTFSDFDLGSESLLWYKKKPEGYAISFNTRVYPEGHYLVGELRTGAYSLRIVGTDVTHEGEYKCEAEVATLTSSAELILLDRHPTCDVYPGVTVKAGDDATFNCTVYKAVPPGELRWRMDGDIVSRGGTSSTYSWMTSFDRTQNNVTMVCGLEYITLFEPFACEDTIVMDVQYLSDVVIHFESDGKVIEGHSYYANCTVDANPTAIISWTTPTGDVTFVEELAKEDARRADSGNYTCTANVTFWDGTVEVSQDRFYLDVQYMSYVVIEDKSNGKVIEGHTYRANCSVDANPTVIIAWLTPRLEMNVSDELKIAPAKRNDTGNYTCEASTEFWDGSDDLRKASVFLDVQYLSTIDMTVSPTTQVIEGEDVSIRCLATDGNPDPHVMSLIRDTKEILAEDEGSELKYDIRGINRSHSGVYRCRATTRFYDRSVDFAEEKQNIIVQFSPEIIYEETRFEASIGDTVSMSCKVYGVPRSVVSWFAQNDSLIHGDEENHNITNKATDGEIMVTSTLTVNVADESYYGTYTCKAMNNIEPDVELSFEITIPLISGAMTITITFAVTVAIISLVVGVVNWCRRKGMKGEKTNAGEEPDGSSLDSEPNGYTESIEMSNIFMTQGINWSSNRNPSFVSHDGNQGDEKAEMFDPDEDVSYGDLDFSGTGWPEQQRLDKPHETEKSEYASIMPALPNP